MRFFFDKAQSSISKRFPIRPNKDTKSAKAGIDRLTPYMDYLNLLDIAGGDVLKIQEAYDINLYVGMNHLMIISERDAYSKRRNQIK